MSMFRSVPNFLHDAYFYSGGGGPYSKLIEKGPRGALKRQDEGSLIG